jgi:hypothetical protein
MNYIKRWLLPILTALVVLGAVLLPQKLSLLRDQALLGGIHREPLTADALSASTSPLTLEERMELFCRWRNDQGESSAISWALDNQSTPEEMPALEELVEKERDSLEETGVLSQNALPQDLTGLSGSRVSVRLAEDLRSATFLELEVTEPETGAHWSLVLDEETGSLIELAAFFPQEGVYAVAADLGAGFFDRLGMGYQIETAERDYAEFLLWGEMVYEVALIYTDDGYCYLNVEPTGGVSWYAEEGTVKVSVK